MRRRSFFMRNLRVLLPLLLGLLVLTGCGSNESPPLPATGSFKEFPVSTAYGSLFSIATGPDGNLWFTEGHGNKIGRIAPDGTIVEFPVPPRFGPLWITPGPDGNL